MGTQYYVGLFYEDTNEKGEIQWYRMHYTHARTYEQALDQLLPRLSQWGSIRTNVKWLLVWKDRKGKVFQITQVTKAVLNQWGRILRARFPRKCEWCYQMKKGCKIVQVLKWKNEESRGLRDMCPSCRRLIRHEIRVTKLVEKDGN